MATHMHKCTHTTEKLYIIYTLGTMKAPSKTLAPQPSTKTRKSPTQYARPRNLESTGLPMSLQTMTSLGSLHMSSNSNINGKSSSSSSSSSSNDKNRNMSYSLNS